LLCKVAKAILLVFSLWF